MTDKAPSHGLGPVFKFSRTPIPSPSFGHAGKKELARLQRESYLKIYKAYCAHPNL